MENLVQDIRYALRVIRAAPGYAFAAVVVLALGIGTNVGMFSILDALVLRPLDLPRLERLVSIMETEPSQVGSWNELSPGNYLDYQAQAQSFERFAVARPADYNLAAGGQPEFIDGAVASAGFFEIMGVQPAVGRFFTSEETAAGSDGRAVVLSHDLWVRRFASNPKVVGTTIRLNAKDCTIVGVAPRSVNQPFGAALWTPLILPGKDKADRTNFHLFGYGLLKPGVTVEQAHAELNAIALRLAQQYPNTNTGRGAQVWPLRRFAAGNTQDFILFEFGAVAFVLLIACANVANLQLAQAAGRRKEIALRLALGARGGRVLRQLLTENIVLALVAVPAALFFAQWAIDATLSMMPAEIRRFVPGWDNIALNWRALLFALSVAVGTGALTGLLPALKALRPDLQTTLREVSSGAPGGKRLRSLLVLGEVALSMVLLTGAALMVKGFVGLLQLGSQHNPASLLTFRLSPPPSETPEQALKRVQFYEQLQTRLEALPGAKQATAVTFLPHGGRSSDEPFSVEGDAPRPSSELPVARMQSALPGYFSTMNIPILNGRAIGAQDGPKTEPVAVISRALAHRYFAGRDPIGMRIRLGHNQNTGTWVKVVGVAGDVVHNWFDDKQIVPTLYRPLPQAPRRAMDIAVRVTGDPYLLVPAIRAEVARFDPELPLLSVKTMDRVIFESFTGLRYCVYIIGTVALIALLLAAIGIYAVISYVVAERTHEIGIRLALGASASQVRGAVLGQSLRLVGAGVAVGLVGAVAFSHALSWFLFGVTPADAFSYAAVSGLFLITGLLASWLPARRAMKVDPIIALRAL